MRNRRASPPLCGRIKLLDYLCIYFDGICGKTICLNIYIYIFFTNMSIPNKLLDQFSFLPAGGGAVSFLGRGVSVVPSFHVSGVGGVAATGLGRARKSALNEHCHPLDPGHTLLAKQPLPSAVPWGWHWLTSAPGVERQDSARLLWAVAHGRWAPPI